MKQTYLGQAVHLSRSYSKVNTNIKEQVVTSWVFKYKYQGIGCN